ncbi:MAG: hypothetical protein IMZ62_05740 [Chloroflexi bacterium]|nr:hypothetical protein [Chloroflexota bacterium]
MTIENEKTKEISNAQLLVDIANTQLEQEAYKILADGYETLSTLPENQESGQSNIYYFKHREFYDLSLRCRELLEKLLALKVLRGIES